MLSTLAWWSLIESNESLHDSDQLVGSVGVAALLSCGWWSCFRIVASESRTSSKLLPTEWSRAAHIEFWERIECRGVWHLSHKSFNKIFTALTSHLGVKDLDHRVELLPEMVDLILILLSFLLFVCSRSLRRNLIPYLLLLICVQSLIRLEFSLEFIDLLLAFKEVFVRIGKFPTSLLSLRL